MAAHKSTACAIGPDECRRFGCRLAFYMRPASRRPGSPACDRCSEPALYSGVLDRSAKLAATLDQSVCHKSVRSLRSGSTEYRATLLSAAGLNRPAPSGLLAPKTYEAHPAHHYYGMASG